jgi:hypothetical protein
LSVKHCWFRNIAVTLADTLKCREMHTTTDSLFGWLVADGWCWFVLREEYCWLVDGGWFVVREKYCWLVADKPSEQGANYGPATLISHHKRQQKTTREFQ